MLLVSCFSFFLQKNLNQVQILIQKKHCYAQKKNKIDSKNNKTKKFIATNQ